MNGSSEIDLTADQRGALRSALARFADLIDTVGVYGSRVQGHARPGSDVDLVLYGPLDARDEADIRTALEDSDLSIFADVVAYDGIGHDALRAQIDHWMKPLFARDDLLATPPALAA